MQYELIAPYRHAAIEMFTSKYSFLGWMPCDHTVRYGAAFHAPNRIRRCFFSTKWAFHQCRHHIKCPCQIDRHFIQALMRWGGNIYAAAIKSHCNNSMSDRCCKWSSASRCVVRPSSGSRQQLMKCVRSCATCQRSHHYGQRSQRKGKWWRRCPNPHQQPNMWHRWRTYHYTAPQVSMRSMWRHRRISSILKILRSSPPDAISSASFGAPNDDAGTKQIARTALPCWGRRCTLAPPTVAVPLIKVDIAAKYGPNGQFGLHRCH